MHVPIAAPFVPKSGIGPSPRMSTMFKSRLRTVIVTPSRIGVRASPAERNAPLILKKIIIAILQTNKKTQKRQRFRFDVWRGMNKIEQTRGQQITKRRHDAERNEERCEKPLIDRAIHFFFVARARKTRDQHAHAGKQRRDENDDDEKDLPAHADRRVCLVTDKMPDEHVVHHALQSADRIRQHRGPRDLPNRWLQRAFNDRTIETSFS